MLLEIASCLCYLLFEKYNVPIPKTALDLNVGDLKEGFFLHVW